MSGRPDADTRSDAFRRTGNGHASQGAESIRQCTVDQGPLVVSAVSA